jgi:hypothetical protein
MGREAITAGKHYAPVHSRAPGVLTKAIGAVEHLIIG